MERQLAGGNRLHQGFHELATRGSGIEHVTCLGPTHLWLWKPLRRKYPLSQRERGAEDDSSADNPGRKGCLTKGQQGSDIDSYFLRSRLNQSTEVQQQDKNQSLQDINNPVSAEEKPGTGEQPEPSPLRPAAEKKIQGRKPLIKWPKSCEKAMWEEVNADLCNILEMLRGTTMKKLERMGELIYSYGAERL
ncbi:hypothetical protein SKAU_G00248340 [Synaphobranchus kaupii]|uniref:Uncharacterized protein n=1 Tax=Synaphobranchus kaupii TaxID=118154 RepID=A0A9Q1F2A3_SYNKA|nr:hypothetical protein SKAU_G00248340 [Synaphobranchus kaupii]